MLFVTVRRHASGWTTIISFQRLDEAIVVWGIDSYAEEEWKTPMRAHLMNLHSRTRFRGTKVVLVVHDEFGTGAEIVELARVAWPDCVYVPEGALRADGVPLTRKNVKLDMDPEQIWVPCDVAGDVRLDAFYDHLLSQSGNMYSTLAFGTHAADIFLWRD